MSLDFAKLANEQLVPQLSRYLTDQGESAEHSTQAAALALPAVTASLLKGLSDRPESIAHLYDYLFRGSMSEPIDEAFGAPANSRESEFAVSLGKRLMPSLMGGNAADTAEVLAVQSGISKTSASSLLGLALTVLLSVLRRKDNGAAGLLHTLNSQQEWLSHTLNPEMLKALGIGSLPALAANLSAVSSGMAYGGGAALGKGDYSAVGAANHPGYSGGRVATLVLSALMGLLALKTCSLEPKTVDLGKLGVGSHVQTPAVLGGEAADTVPPTPQPMPEAVSVPPAAVPQATEQAASVSATSAESQPAAETADAARVVNEGGVLKFYFASGKDEVAAGAEAQAAEIVAAAKAGKKLAVSGFADSTGNAAANEALSKKRAQAVQAFLQAQGVDASNIELRKPDNTTGAQGNQAEGRRVEVSIIE